MRAIKNSKKWRKDIRTMYGVGTAQVRRKYCSKNGGFWGSGVSYQLLAVSYQLLAISCQLLAISCELFY